MRVNQWANHNRVRRTLLAIVAMCAVSAVACAPPPPPADGVRLDAPGCYENGSGGSLDYAGPIDSKANAVVHLGGNEPCVEGVSARVSVVDSYGAAEAKVKCQVLGQQRTVPLYLLGFHVSGGYWVCFN